MPHGHIRPASPALKVWPRLLSAESMTKDGQEVVRVIHQNQKSVTVFNCSGLFVVDVTGLEPEQKAYFLYLAQGAHCSMK